MPKAIEAEVVHLVYGLLGGPFLNSDTISGNENPCAIFAEPAMNENLGVVIKERKKLRYLIVRWIRPAANWNTDKINAQPVGFFLFLIARSGIFDAKINNRRNADLFQLGKALNMWLSTAVKLLADFAGIRNTRDMDSFTAVRTDCCVSDLGSLRISGANPNSEIKTKKTQGQTTHISLISEVYHAWPR